jgi:GAF domain-containing protein
MIQGCDAAGVTLVRSKKKLETPVSTEEWVARGDALQYELGEGPCFDAINDDTAGDVVTAEHLAEDRRWPRYVPKAAQAGVRAQLGVRLYADHKAVGGLNFYSTQADTIHPDAEQGAELFAIHAALALGHARHDAELNEALASRSAIAQATGVIMERYQLPRVRAFQCLVRMSARSNTKLRDLAATLLDSAEDGYAASHEAPPSTL